MKKIGIAGAGLGSLSAAAYLLNSGYEIHIFEKNSSPGGKINELNLNGFRFDTGPSLVTMPEVLKDLFFSAGEDINELLELIPIDPICRNFFSDGKTIDTSSDVSKMSREIENISKNDAENYTDFLEYTKKIYDNSADLFLYSPLHEVKQIIQEHGLKSIFNVLKLDVFNTMHQSVKEYFKHPSIVKLFDRYATYNGSDPFQAPATLNIISYVEYVLGGYYIKGGIYRLVDKLTEILQSKGVKFHFNSEVDKILIENKSIEGLRINGEDHEFDLVISNSDVVNTYKELIDNFESQTRKVSELEPSLSGMIFFWGVEGEYPKLEHHNVFFSDDYRNEFDDIFKRKIPPEDPTIYIAVTSKTDIEHAPGRAENWFVLLNMPYTEKNIDWEKAALEQKGKIIEKLKRHGINAEGKIKEEKIYTPVELRDMFYSNKGSIYGISSNTKMTAFKRHSNRSKKIKGLYFAGGSVHPGGGIPLVILSGKHVAGLIKKSNNQDFI